MNVTSRPFPTQDQIFGKNFERVLSQKPAPADADTKGVVDQCNETLVNCDKLMQGCNGKLL